ncbi:conserved hypothetical protein [Aminomonas paucivorans DSM 12260]|uniref:Uncharacterized protein n=1 Tax=Aminomonas paucivorans DSM 12260 TaxID=584708 RepID=E3CYS5_9BACT|nr:hypothetical protein [Aminomonas paucivorans]EFQ23703.1 conserved hypothetical protein [Aminomonas paucivorans DSM 12260]
MSFSLRRYPFPRPALGLLPFLIAAWLFPLPAASWASGCTSQDLFALEIPLNLDGVVQVHLPDGSTRELGRVVALPEKTRWPSFTATRWGVPGSVAASAVNALHLLVDVEQGKGRTLSLIPQKTVAPAAGPGASVVLDAEAGTGVFGAWAPPVGNPVRVRRADGEEGPLSGSLIPRMGDTLWMHVRREEVPYLVDLENRPGGRVYAWSRSRGAKLIGRVLRPVRGVGRFEGTLFQDRGRLRANHPGVIDISTSPHGVVGGFQILPMDHGKSSEMQGAWTMTQWLVVAAPDGSSPLVGTPPLFSGGLVPGPGEGEALWDLWSTYGRRPLVLCRIDGGPWEKLPEVSGRQDQALAKLTHLRIYFPVIDEPLAPTPTP